MRRTYFELIVLCQLSSCLCFLLWSVCSIKHEWVCERSLKIPAYKKYLRMRLQRTSVFHCLKKAICLCVFDCILSPNMVGIYNLKPKITFQHVGSYRLVTHEIIPGKIWCPRLLFCHCRSINKSIQSAVLNCNVVNVSNKCSNSSRIYVHSCLFHRGFRVTLNVNLVVCPL